MGEVAINRVSEGGFVLCHRDDLGRGGSEDFSIANDAIRIAKFDDAGNYRPLKTAPNLCHGWRLNIVDVTELRRALDYFYPGRLAVYSAWKRDRLKATPLRETLERQSGMYRVAGKISDERLNVVVAETCRSDGGCLRTILWKRNAYGTVPSTLLPVQKYDAAVDQTGRGENALPLICQEVCAVLVEAARKAVKLEGAAPSAPGH